MMVTMFSKRVWESESGKVIIKSQLLPLDYLNGLSLKPRNKACDKFLRG